MKCLQFSEHMHLPFEICRDRLEHLKELRTAGYDGIWSIESHFGSNEYNNVANQIANVRRVLCRMDYPGMSELRKSGKGIMPACFARMRQPSTPKQEG